jgi:sirohydrochlorin ferrochelatase
MAQPLLSDLLGEIARRGYQRVIVQPHFLFHGELVEFIASQVARTAAEHSHQEWIVTRPLADLSPDAAVAADFMQKVIHDRCGQAGIHVVAPAAHD